MDKEFIEKLGEMIAETKIQSIAETARHPFMTAPEYVKIHDLEKFLPAPKQVSSLISFDELNSFITYTKEFKTEATKVFAKRKKDHCIRLQADIEFHSKEKPSWNKHHAVMEFSLSEEFRMWTAISNQYIEQLNFAEFLETNLHHVVEPDGATMLEVATYLEGARNVKFIGAHRLNSGAVSFQHDETIEVKTKSPKCPEVPTSLRIAIPVYENTPPVEIDLLLKYRVTKESALLFSISFIRLPELIRSAFINTVNEVEQQLGLKVLWGGEICS